ncbi:MAG: FIST C-terminal domain-containing protein [Sulfuritalea sp.]|nr:FIST C-terminal domain-containing protein [Sulfuritalea sp.]
MQVKQIVLKTVAGADTSLAALAGIMPQLVTVFGAVPFFTDKAFQAALRAALPDAAIIGCSTAGEISNDGVADGSCVITAVNFSGTRIRAATSPLRGMEDSLAAGARIGGELAATDLRALMVFGPGVQINGSALVDGIASKVGTATITGGLAGDGGAFAQTWTLGQAGVGDNAIVAVGLYGDALDFAHGSFGGWEPFGPSRKVTRCDGNVLYELDGEPALEVYKRYLGDHAKGLPASGLLFPFAMVGEDHNAIGLIRTILGVDEANGSLTLAGAINPDGYLKLMHASTDRLVNGAESAAEAAQEMHQSSGDSLAILVSCVGRKLVMGDRVDEEVEAVAEVFGSKATLTGFYSYGEISPFTPGSACHLHNQTMTITWMGEK